MRGADHDPLATDHHAGVGDGDGGADEGAAHRRVQRGTQQVAERVEEEAAQHGRSTQREVRAVQQRHACAQRRLLPQLARHVARGPLEARDPRWLEGGSWRR